MRVIPLNPFCPKLTKYLLHCGITAKNKGSAIRTYIYHYMFSLLKLKWIYLICEINSSLLTGLVSFRVLFWAKFDVRILCNSSVSNVSEQREYLVQVENFYSGKAFSCLTYIEVCCDSCYSTVHSVSTCIDSENPRCWVWALL